MMRLRDVMTIKVTDLDEVMDKKTSAKQSQFIYNSCNVIADSKAQRMSHLAGNRHNQIIQQKFNKILSGSNSIQ